MKVLRLSGSLVDDVLGRDHRPLDDEDVEPGVEGELVVAGDPLGGQEAAATALALISETRRPISSGLIGSA